MMAPMCKKPLNQCWFFGVSPEITCFHDFPFSFICDVRRFSYHNFVTMHQCSLYNL